MTALATLTPCANNERVKTLTITEGRARLGYWLRKATQGHDIGFVIEGKIVALRPVEVASTDYSLREYGLTPKEMAAAEKRIHKEIMSARARGELTPFTDVSDEEVEQREREMDSGQVIAISHQEFVRRVKEQRGR